MDFVSFDVQMWFYIKLHCLENGVTFRILFLRAQHYFNHLSISIYIISTDILGSNV